MKTLTKTVILYGTPDNGNWDRQIAVASIDPDGKAWAFYGYFQMGNTWKNLAVLIRTEI